LRRVGCYYTRQAVPPASAEAGYQRIAVSGLQEQIKWIRILQSVQANPVIR
jgi:hypothetical protein